MTNLRVPTGWSAVVASVVGWVVWAGVAGTAVSQTSGAGAASGPDESSTSASSESETDEPSLRERIERRLSGYHFQPDREVFDGMASEGEVAETLRQIAGDETVRPSLRTRAVDLLGRYPSEETESFLAAYLEPPAEDLSEKRRRAYGVIRLHAITSLAELREGERVVETLEGLLDADDLQVRLMVVAALGEHGGEAGKERLRELADETDDEIIEREIRTYVETE